MARPGRESGGEVKEKRKDKIREPQLYNVILYNDDYTTMEFVEHAAEAFRIMIDVHRRGRGVCGAYTYEIAETKVATVHEMARGEGFPLRAGVEEA